MVKLIAFNSGVRTQAIRETGGLTRLKPGREATVEPVPDLDDAAIEHFRSVGVSFRDPASTPAVSRRGHRKETRVDKKAAADAAAKAAAEKAAADKLAAEKAAADRAAADKVTAMKAAEDAVLAAMAKVEKVGDDMVAKAAAEDELKAAEAALASLKG